MSKNALFVFNGDPICFVHVLLNALDMKSKGDEVRIILEGASVKLLPELSREENPLNSLWKKAMEAGIVDGVCRACAQKLGSLDDALQQGLELLDDMSGHVGMAGYQERGFIIITF
ncbi:MAG: DsrE family protein [Desulfamplus sp.]|nr:DsrE family protein [Desulfamplus sp.]MBF0259782.1 DsrE family protein [Desulfamplus sp.]